MRLHFDGYSECHDFWLNADSPDIHPAGWFEETGHKLQPPKGKELVSLSWWVLLKEEDEEWAPKHRAGDGDRVAPWGPGGDGAVLGGVPQDNRKAPIMLKISARSHFGAKPHPPGCPSARLEPAALPRAGGTGTDAFWGGVELWISTPLLTFPSTPSKSAVGGKPWALGFPGLL